MNNVDWDGLSVNDRMSLSAIEELGGTVNYSTRIIQGGGTTGIQTVATVKLGGQTKTFYDNPTGRYFRKLGMCAENNVMTGKNNMSVPIKDIMPIISVGYKNSPAHKTATSMLLGFTPVVGDIKDFQEAITGYDIVAGEKLTVASRGVTLVAAFIPIASGKSLRVTYDVAKIKSTKSLKALNKKFGVKIPSKLLDEGASGANSLKLEGRGSTGRTVANDVMEQTAMKDAMKNPFEHIQGSREVSIVKDSLSDSRWLGWEKWQIVYRTNEGRNITIHFNYDSINGLFDDFKFK